MKDQREPLQLHDQVVQGQKHQAKDNKRTAKR